MTAIEFLPQTVRARELYGDFWFNSEPVPVAAMRGQVILIHFWDYTSVACVRNLPYLREWERRYREYGLVVVGVHTPRFNFGKNPEYVQNAVRRYGISYPVVMDNEATIASQYGSMQWPTMMLIDKDGFIRYQNAGEGNYAGTEHALQTLLYHAGVGEELPTIMEPVREGDRQGAVLYRTSPDLYAGYARGSIGNVEGYSPESIIEYEDPGIYLNGRFYVDGPWLNAKECIQFNGTEGHIILDYEALEISVVMKSEGNVPVRATVIQDGRPLEAGVCGEDVRLLPGGQSVVTVDAPRMYALVRNTEHGRHLLRLGIDSPGLSLYAFAFAGGAIPELISSS
jgi:peroxiredoxin